MKKLCFAIIGVGIVTAGCLDPVAQKRSLARQRAVANTIERLGKRERERPQQVRNDLMEIGPMWREAERQRTVNNQSYAKAWRDEVRDWQVRRYDYVQEAEEVFAGDVKGAHDTAVQMID